MKGKNCAKKNWHTLLSAVDSQYINTNRCNCPSLGRQEYTWRPRDSRSANGIHLCMHIYYILLRKIPRHCSQRLSWQAIIRRRHDLQLVLTK